MFIKTSWSNSLIFLQKLILICIFKLGISHYVLMEAAEVIHISTSKLAFSVLILLVHIKNKFSIFFRVYRDHWGISLFVFINSDFTGFFCGNELKTKPAILCGPKDLRGTEDLIWIFCLNCSVYRSS